MPSKLTSYDPDAIEQWSADRRDELAAVQDESDLVGFVTRQREQIAAPPWSLNGIDLMRKHSNLMDMTIARMFDLALRQADAAGELRPSSGQSQIAIAATGGYGRRELSPYSDIDVVFIASDDAEPAQDAIVRRMFHLFMDIFLNGVKLKVGYAYRQPGQCLGLPHETQTALLDFRLLAGNEQLFNRFRSTLRRSIDPLAFLRRNKRQRDKTRTRFGGSPYRVEPNVKEGAGGLRDIHAARWAAQVAFDVPGTQALDELKAQGALSSGDVERTLGALSFISGVRNLMHITSGRGSDALTVERQQTVAAAVDWPAEVCAVDQLMQRYYRHAEDVDYVTAKVLRFCDEQRFSIEPGIYSAKSQIHLDSVEDAQKPGLIARIIKHAQEYDLGISQSARDAIREMVRDGNPPTIRESQTLLDILGRRRPSATLTQMAEIGALQWMLPQFGALMYLLPGDAAHEHTVGEHSLQVVRNLDGFRDEEDEEIRGILAEVPDFKPLYLAGLLHDLGKLQSDGDHAERGCLMFQEIAVRLGMSDDDTASVSGLIRHHLLMGDTARLRDLNETRTVSEFAAVVGSMDMLRMLFLLTIADSRAVGDTAWSAIHMRFLRELYHRAARQLSNPATQDYELDVERHRRRVRRELTLVNLPPEEVDEHSGCMPVSYLLNTSPEDIALHIEYVRQVRAGSPVVELRDDPTGDFTKLTVCALDDPRPGMLAKIAGVLYAVDVDIHAAEVFTRENSDRIALDSLYLDFEGCQLPEFKKRQVAAAMTDVLTGATSLEDLLNARNKPLKRPLDVHDMAVLSHVSDRHTVLEVSATDCEGLLYHLTRAISSLGWNIHNARVTTFSGRARDAFYVTDVNGEKLKSGSGRKLRAALGPPAG